MSRQSIVSRVCVKKINSLFRLQGAIWVISSHVCGHVISSSVYVQTISNQSCLCQDHQQSAIFVDMSVVVMFVLRSSIVSHVYVKSPSNSLVVSRVVKESSVVMIVCGHVTSIRACLQIINSQLCLCQDHQQFCLFPGWWMGHQYSCLRTSQKTSHSKKTTNPFLHVFICFYKCGNIFMNVCNNTCTTTSHHGQTQVQNWNPHLIFKLTYIYLVMGQKNKLSKQTENIYSYIQFKQIFTLECLNNILINIHQ